MGKTPLHLLQAFQRASPGASGTGNQYTPFSFKGMVMYGVAPAKPALSQAFVVRFPVFPAVSVFRDS
jgi:hypothetical protein